MIAKTVRKNKRILICTDMHKFLHLFGYCELEKTCYIGWRLGTERHTPNVYFSVLAYPKSCLKRKR